MDASPLHLWPRRSGVGGFLRCVRELRAERYELAVDLQRITKSAALARLSGASRVLGADLAPPSAKGLKSAPVQSLIASNERALRQVFLAYAHDPTLHRPILSLQNFCVLCLQLGISPPVPKPDLARCFRGAYAAAGVFRLPRELRASLPRLSLPGAFLCSLPRGSLPAGSAGVVASAT